MLLNANGLYSGLENVSCYVCKSVTSPSDCREIVPGDGLYPGAAIRSTASRKLLLHMVQREKAPKGLRDVVTSASQWCYRERENRGTRLSTHNPD